MTESGAEAAAGEQDRERRCRWCQRRLREQVGPGRRRQFCSQACRQWDWVARQRARELALSDGELVMAREELDGLHDDLYVLSCAIEDALSDLADVDAMAASKQAPELRRILDWLLTAATPLRDRQLTAAAAAAGTATPPSVSS